MNTWPPLPADGSPWRSALLVLAALLLAALGFLAWQRSGRPRPLPAGGYEVAHADIAKASALAWQGDALLTAEELKDGKGLLLRIDAQGRRSVLSEGLYKPDGLVPYQDGFAYSQEGGTHPIRWFDAAGSPRSLHRYQRPGALAEGKRLYAWKTARGRPPAALRRRRWHLTVLRDHLDEAESFTAARTAVPSIPRNPAACAPAERRWPGSAGAARSARADLSALRPPRPVDQRRHDHRARLLLWDRQSAPRAILTFLRAPQACCRGRRLSLAEGGRDRIIALEPR